MAERRDIEFNAEGVTLRGWFYPATSEVCRDWIPARSRPTVDHGGEIPPTSMCQRRLSDVWWMHL